MNKQQPKQPRLSLLDRIRVWWKKRQHLKLRKQGLIPEVTILRDGRMVLSKLTQEKFNVTSESSIILYCSNDDVTELAISFAPKGDPKGFKVSGGKEGRPFFIRMDKYFKANDVTPPHEDIVGELIDINQESMGYPIYRVIDKTSIK